MAATSSSKRSRRSSSPSAVVSSSRRERASKGRKGTAPSSRLSPSAKKSRPATASKSSTRESSGRSTRSSNRASSDRSATGSIREGRWQRIYALVDRIPPGRVASYGQVARLAGLGRGARQVGYALHALPLGSSTPWHRVVNRLGEISLRRTEGAGSLQRILLEREGIRFDQKGRIELNKCGWAGSHPEDSDEAPGSPRTSFRGKPPRKIPYGGT